MAVEYDAWGRPVAKWLSPVFAGRRRLLSWLARLERLRGQLMLMCNEPYARYVDQAAVGQHFQNLRSLVEKGLPFVECDCGAYDNCPKCENQRWVKVDQVQQS